MLHICTFCNAAFHPILSRPFPFPAARGNISNHCPPFLKPFRITGFCAFRLEHKSVTSMQKQTHNSPVKLFYDTRICPFRTDNLTAPSQSGICQHCIRNHNYRKAEHHIWLVFRNVPSDIPQWFYDEFHCLFPYRKMQAANTRLTHMQIRYIQIRFPGT